MEDAAESLHIPRWIKIVGAIVIGVALVTFLIPLLTLIASFMGILQSVMNVGGAVANFIDKHFGAIMGTIAGSLGLGGLIIGFRIIQDMRGKKDAVKSDPKLSESEKEAAEGALDEATDQTIGKARRSVQTGSPLSDVSPEDQQEINAAAEAAVGPNEEDAAKREAANVGKALEKGIKRQRI